MKLKFIEMLSQPVALYSILAWCCLCGLAYELGSLAYEFELKRSQSHLEKLVQVRLAFDSEKLREKVMVPYTLLSVCLLM